MEVDSVTVRYIPVMPIKRIKEQKVRAHLLFCTDTVFSKLSLGLALYFELGLGLTLGLE